LVICERHSATSCCHVDPGLSGITDGTPAGEPKEEIFNVILRTDAELRRTRYGPDAISYQFAQVGNDLKATRFLEELDNHPQIGGMIDCTSNFEVEQAEMSRKSVSCFSRTSRKRSYWTVASP